MISHRSIYCVLVALPVLTWATITTEILPPADDGADLEFFISEPDIRPPRLRVDTYDEKNRSPDYVFTAPYRKHGVPPSPNVYSPVYQSPLIYDRDGNLVWSAAKMTHNFVTTDFKPTIVNGKSHLSFIQQILPSDGETLAYEAVVLDANYEVVRKVNLTDEFDLHEFSIQDDMNSFLKVSNKRFFLADFHPDGEMIVADTCAVEIDTQESVIFEFCPSEGLGYNISYAPLPPGWDLEFRHWDPYHMNAVEKFPNGDLLLSLRHTWSIHKVSRETGQEIWRLGGQHSNFDQDFDFSWQHDARIISQNSTVTVISFLDNADIENESLNGTGPVSSFKVVALYEEEQPMRAKLLQQFFRPDGGSTRKRGNGRLLSTGGAFVGWSDDGYATEFAVDGTVLQEFRWESSRLGTYRTFLNDWIGTPNTLPAMKTFASPNNKGAMSSTSYVSWNGATEVASWEFFGSDDREEGYQSLGTVAKAGFETSFVSQRAWKYTRVRAKDIEDRALSESAVIETIGFRLIAQGDRSSSKLSDWSLVDVVKIKPRQILIAGLFVAFIISGLAMIMRAAGPMTLRRLRRKVSNSPQQRPGYRSFGQTKKI